jgi:hypothetical protein
MITMMLKSKPWLAVSVIVALGVPALAEMPTGGQLMVPEGAQQAAVKSLQIFKQLAAPANGRSLALEAPGAQHATLGAPIKDYIIGLASLQNWDGQNPATLLHATGRLIYPIVTNGMTQSSMTLAKTKGEWTAVTFGSPSEAKSRSLVQKTLNASAPGGNVGAIQVRVPALNAVFIAQKVEGKLELTPIVSQPSLGIEAGKTEQATLLLLRLQPAARQLNLNTPN